MNKATQRKLTAELTGVIDNWTGEMSETADWIDGWVGDNTIRLMAEAAIGILEATEDVQDYMQGQDLLRE